MTAVAHDHFSSLLGDNRGAQRAGVEPVPEFDAFTAEDLDTLDALAEDPGLQGTLKAAHAEREVLALIDEDAWRSLEGSRCRHLDPDDWDTDPLVRKLSDCSLRLFRKEEEALAAAGGRPLGMYTVAGNVAVTKLVDSMVGLDPAAARKAWREGAESIAVAHGEVFDTDVREAAYGDLQRLGVDADAIFNG